MALELVLARKAVIAAVFAPEYRAWELLLVRVSAMLGLVVAFEVTKILGDGMTVLRKTRILSRLAVVAFLMRKELFGVEPLKCVGAAGKTALGS